MFPGMLPPPTPFKLFVLGAAVAEMNWIRFLLAIFAGRFVRFLALSLLALYFGPEIVGWFGSVFSGHIYLLIVTLITAGLLGFFYWKLRERRRVARNSVAR
jgi:uncharacterized membrane protein YdjX (TVP38/TMEM64 family)